MKKANYERKVKRESGLGTTDALWKLLIDIFWARKQGEKYSLNALCVKHQLSKFNSVLLEGMPLDEFPTRERAEDLRVRIRNYEKENYHMSKEESSQDPTLDLVEAEAKECNDFGILKWNGHYYRLVLID